MEKKALLYEGKAKKVFSTENPSMVIVSYKDDATAFDGQKKGTVAGKGAVRSVAGAGAQRRDCFIHSGGPFCESGRHGAGCGATLSAGTGGREPGMGGGFG